MTVRILQGDCRSVLATLPDASVHCCVTSPPYWGLRDYGVAGQLGMEPDYRDHIAVMVEVFREVRRVLRADGTLWLNYGDCYASSINGRSAADTKAVGNDDRTFRDKPFSTVQGVLKPKDLVMMPARVAIALQEDGWWLRSDIIWSKPNPMPESITDRPSSAHEHVFLLTKSARYFYDPEAVREEGAGRVDIGDMNYPGREGGGWATNSKEVSRIRKFDKQRGHSRRHDGFNDRWDKMSKDEQCSGGRNLRNVWTIATAPFAESHFATFPPDLAKRCILAGTSEKGCCSICATPWTRIIIKGEPDMTHRIASGSDASGNYDGQSTKDHDSHGVQNSSDVKRRILDGMREKTYDWKPTCSCGLKAQSPVPCTVLDCFAGAFTAPMVADRLQRNAIGIELNPDYCAMAERRLQKDAGLFADLA